MSLGYRERLVEVYVAFITLNCYKCTIAITFVVKSLAYDLPCGLDILCSTVASEVYDIVHVCNMHLYYFRTVVYVAQEQVFNCYSHTLEAFSTVSYVFIKYNA